MVITLMIVGCKIFVEQSSNLHELGVIFGHMLG